MLDGVHVAADDGVVGDYVTFDAEAAGENLAPGFGAAVGVHAEGLVDRGLEIDARCKQWSGLDVVEGGESGADFRVELFKSFGVVDEVEEQCCHHCGSCVRTGSREHVRFFTKGDGIVGWFSRFNIFGVDEEVEHVLSLCLFANSFVDLFLL